jgi:glycosyltransferase involved in cell wall biosynthesis
LLEESDVMFFPTCYPEGMPIAILEGMMHGMAIISRNVGGIPDHIKNVENGCLTDSIDPAIFAEYVIQLISNYQLYNQISRNNSIFANLQFTPERLITKLFELYESDKYILKNHLSVE